MTCNVISTGSRGGNAVLVNGSLLFDCGVPLYKLEPYIKGIRIVFLTHVHCDHFNIRTIRRIHASRPTIRFVCAKNMLVDLVSRAKVSPRNVILVNPEDPPTTISGTEFGESIEISTFQLVHDVENVGYIFSVSGGQEDGTAMYCTDTHHIPVYAPDLDLYMIEANYRSDEIGNRMQKKVDSGEFFYENRVLESHMSLETAVDWLSDNADPLKSKIVFLHGHMEKEGDNFEYTQAIHNV